jgi:L-iditol 2-dehydrogenase
MATEKKKTMRVAVYYRNSDVRLEERAIPAIGPDELLVKVMASGICGSDILEWYRIKKAPLVLGHEIAGLVEEAGPKVSKFKPGNRVFVSHHVPCNTCPYCLAGHHTACQTLHTTNFDPGGFAQYIRVPALNVDRGTLLLPEEISFEEGTFIEPLGCVLRGQRVAGLRPGQSVLVMGSGLSGLLHIKLAVSRGAGLVVATDISPFRLKMALACGAGHTFQAEEFSAEKLRQVNEGRLADLVILCTGALSAAHQALASVDRGGTVLFFAVPHPDDRLVLPANEFWRNEITLKTSYAASPEDLSQTVEILRHKRLTVTDLITHRLPLAETGLGFRLVEKADDSMKIIINPQK